MLFALLLQAALSPLDVTGVWLIEDGTAQVEIEEAGDSVAGTINWYADMEKEPVFDTENEDPEAAKQELLGLEMLRGFERSSTKWRKGEIYDPTSGKVYRSAISRAGEDTLAVQGCVGFICKTQAWRRVPDDEVRRANRMPLTLTRETPEG